MLVWRTVKMDKKNLTVEQAGELIEQYVSKLESEALPLKESMELYTKICELIEFSMTELNGYQGKITEVNERLAQLGAENWKDAAELEGADFYEE
jgi:exodeoxyribonuclease VII small subunit